VDGRDSNVQNSFFFKQKPMEYIVSYKKREKKAEAKKCDTETNLHKFEVVGDQNIAFVLVTN
jgi:hypothetical protein